MVWDRESRFFLQQVKVNTLKMPNRCRYNCCKGGGSSVKIIRMNIRIQLCATRKHFWMGWNHTMYIMYVWSRFAVRYHPPPPPTWYGPKTCVLQHSAWKRCICSVFCMVGCWCGPQPCKFVGFLQPTFRKRVICNVSASTSWSSAAAPSSISVSNYHIILNLLLRVFSLGTGLISVYILCLSNFLLECLVFRNWSNLKFS